MACRESTKCRTLLIDGVLVLSVHYLPQIIKLIGVLVTVARFESLLRGLCHLSTFSRSYKMFTVRNIQRCRMFMFVCVASHAYVIKHVSYQSSYAHYTYKN